ncbi:hypothetical protein AC578_7776 [Pseudocercospora eumusae]|uniref:Uncharacterized protein n=1 Tax=Pseudocercospora eumusae TaxID=321146 RepID=A0A139H144_9PEZI|nr:hypothetical protein AC578_7776 [Pseudocercospora eumusae]
MEAIGMATGTANRDRDHDESSRYCDSDGNVHEVLISRRRLPHPDPAHAQQWHEIRSQHVRHRITNPVQQRYQEQQVEQKVACRLRGFKVDAKWQNKVEVRSQETRCDPPAANNNTPNQASQPYTVLSLSWEDEMVFDFTDLFQGQGPGQANFSAMTNTIPIPVPVPSPAPAPAPAPAPPQAPAPVSRAPVPTYGHPQPLPQIVPGTQESLRRRHAEQPHHTLLMPAYYPPVAPQHLNHSFHNPDFPSSSMYTHPQRPARPTNHHRATPGPSRSRQTRHTDYESDFYDDISTPGSTPPPGFPVDRGAWGAAVSGSECGLPTTPGASKRKKKGKGKARQ